MELEDSKPSGWIASCTDFGNKPSVSTWLTEPKSSVVGAGLANLGNTCFLNAILQCFTHTVPLLQALLSCNHKVPCDDYSEGFCVFCNLYEHVQSSLVSTGRIISPWKFVNNLNYFSSGFQRFQQEDAHEFLQCFLDKLESCCGDFKMKEVHSKSDNIVKHVFGGRLISMLGCCNCGHLSDTFEPSIDLSLEIEEACNLSTALKSFTKLETIGDPETKFTCENCKEQVSVEKQLRMEQVPSVAVLHLKRFKNDGSVVEKIDKYVAFPLKLDLQPFTCHNEDYEEELKYDLFAVVVHTGFSSTSGHYYCFIRAAPDEWYRFDDSKVVHVHQEYVLSQEAYILFYAKKGTPSFSSFIQTQKRWIDLSLLNTSPKSVLDVRDVCTTSPSVQVSYHSDGNKNSAILGEVSTKVLSGTKDDSSVDGSVYKENLMSPVPSVARDASDLASFEAYQTTKSLDVLSSEAHKSTSLSVQNGSSDVPSCEAEKSVLNSSDDVPSCEVDKSCSDPALRENNSNMENGEIRNISSDMPATPLRSASPEIYREDPPDTTFSISRGHLRSIERVTCKRQLSKELENLETKQALRFIKASIPGSRGQQLVAAIRGSQSEGSVKKKRIRGMHISPSTDERNPNGRRRGSMPSVASNLR